MNNVIVIFYCSCKLVLEQNEYVFKNPIFVGQKTRETGNYFRNALQNMAPRILYNRLDINLFIEMFL